MSVSGAKFYDDLKNDVTIENIETAPENQESIGKDSTEISESKNEEKAEGEES